jgi:hypothetical protein
MNAARNYKALCVQLAKPVAFVFQIYTSLPLPKKGRKKTLGLDYFSFGFYSKKAL